MSIVREKEEQGARQTTGSKHIDIVRSYIS